MEYFIEIYGSLTIITSKNFEPTGPASHPSVTGPWNKSNQGGNSVLVRGQRKN